MFEFSYLGCREYTLSRVFVFSYTFHILKCRLNTVKMKLHRSPLTCIWFVVFLFLSFQKSNLMFKRLDASTLPEDILSNTQTLPMMGHSAGSALWVRARLQICVCVLVSPFTRLFTVSLLSQCRTRGGFVALSPISPQELFMPPISSDTDASQQQNPVRKRSNTSIRPLMPQPCLRAVVLNSWALKTKHCRPQMCWALEWNSKFSFSEWFLTFLNMILKSRTIFFCYFLIVFFIS